LKKSPWIRHIEQIPYEKMPAYYHFAKVGISASWFETTGLTSLEALFCGTNAVASGDRAKEYLGDLAEYCCPESVNSIKEAIKKAYYAKAPIIPKEMRELYTWKKAAQETAEVYRKFLI
jgi:glycosyltransferase involved in cell wall biosynthesis